MNILSAVLALIALAPCRPARAAIIFPGQAISSAAVRAASPEATAAVADLQAMGIPATVSYFTDPSEAIAVLYEHNPTSPTALGRLLRQALGRLDANDLALLQFKLARNDLAQLGEALRILDKAASLQKEGFDPSFAELTSAYMEKAVELLKSEPGAPAAPAGTPTPPMSQVLRRHMDTLSAQKLLYKGVGKVLPALSGASAAEEERLAEAVEALDAVTGGRGQLSPRALSTIVRTLPEEKLTEAQWKALASSFPMGDSVNRMGVMKLWRAGITGKGVTVGVVDNGADEAHPYLKGIRVRQNFTSERRDGKPDNRGEDGTRAAAAIRALAPDAEIRVYKAAPGSGKAPKELQLNEQQQAYAASRALKCASEDGCSIVDFNVTFGAGHPTAPDIITDRIAELKGRTLVVAPSGDKGRDSVTNPAFSPDVLAVGAVSYTGRQKSDSGRGEVLVPRGGKVRLMTKPDCLAYGNEICSAQTNSDSKYEEPEKAFSRKSGTQLAAAHVTAVAALLQQKAAQLGRRLSAEEMRALLADTGSEPAEGPRGVKLVNPAAACRDLDVESQDCPAK